MSGVIRKPVHPGTVLDQRLKALGWTNVLLGKMIDRSPEEVSRMRRAKIDVSAECVLRMAAAFGDPPEEWMKLKLDYDLVQLPMKDHAALVHASSLGSLYRFLPNLREAEALGWLPKDGPIEETARAALKLLGVVDGRKPDLALYKGVGLPASERDLLRAHAWWRFAQRQAKGIAVREFSASRLEASLKEHILGEEWDIVDFGFLQPWFAARGVCLIAATAPKGLGLDGAVQAGNPATIVIPQPWKNLKDVNRIFVRLVSLLLVSQNHEIRLWAEKRGQRLLDAVEQQAVVRAKELYDFRYSLLWHY